MRPQRITARDFSGRSFTLPDEASSWELVADNGEGLLLLGLGPARPPALPCSPPPSGARIHWLEDENTLGQLALPPPPESWQRLTVEEALNKAPHCKIFFYKPGQRLAPHFWGPLLARMAVATESTQKRPGGVKSVWLPGNNLQLLHQEAGRAFLNIGHDKLLTKVPDSPYPSDLLKSWEGGLPDFALSINFRGLDGEGRIFHLLRELEIPLAIWLVDNPWHLLSAIRFPWWKTANLFVTDASHIRPLQDYGAKNVMSCPLAYSPHMLRKPGPGANGKPLFVGRSEFPGKEAFFRGSSVKPELLEEALAKISHEDRERPDYHWWTKKLNVPLWPGASGRLPGLGSDLCSAALREHWLKATLQTGIMIIGDEGWQKRLPGTGIIPPVDYYGILPDLYNCAAAVLNVTSLHLPESLNQRHFDVWTAGGLLLTDKTPGLAIFPKELVEPVALDSPEAFAPRLDWFMNHPEERENLIKAWQAHILANHGYEKRIQHMLAHCK